METVLRNVALCDGSAYSWAGELEIICTAKLLECNIIINWVTESESFVKIYGGIHRSQSYNIILQFKMIISKLSTVVVLNARADLMLCII